MRYLAIAVLQLLLVTAGRSQEHSPQDIVANLLPDHNARGIVDLSPTEKRRAVKQLQVAQKRATGERAQEVAFLLAAYDSDYEKNRDYLIHILRGCSGLSTKLGCNDNTGAFLIVLYKRGHKELLEPLMLVGKDTNGAALAEEVGDFCSEVLLKRPAEFLDTIRQFPARTQRQVCELAGAGDGGGMAPADLKRVRKQLTAKSDEVATRCWRGVETSNRPEQQKK